MNIWKLSQGQRYFSEEKNAELIARHCVCIHPDTPPKGRSCVSQGENFVEVPAGDYFYLCYSNNQIRLFGKFTGKSHNCLLKGMEDWYEQEYELIFESIQDGCYNGEKYWWTPNDNSSFIRVTDNKLYEKLILQPYFGKSLSDIPNMQSKNQVELGVNEKSTITANLVTVGTLLNINLSIPIYQRPYRWTATNVRLLLEDILKSKNTGKKSYRIGSVIIHDNYEGRSLDLVDGQQRVTTLSLLQYACMGTVGDSLKFNHWDSYNNIIGNYEFINSWLNEYFPGSNEQRQEYWNYVCDSCEFVKIVVTDLSEAFQMFDSQNGRGKELEPYNLLKAYHIRAMEQDSRDDKIRCDVRWEAAAQYDPTPKIEGDPNVDILKQLFSEQLYRSRIWSKRREALKFSKQKISEFKGFTIDKNHPAVFPFQNPQLLQYLTAKFYKNVLEGTVATQNRFEFGDNERIDPFVNINQQIVNGKPFFDYVETYVEIYKQMFIHIDTYQLAEFKEFYYSHCLNYGDAKENRKNNYSFLPQYSACRTGDTYLRECYKSLVFVLFDKFGEKGLNKYYKTLYRLVYKERLIKSQVRYKAVAQLPSEYFRVIIEAKDMADLTKLDRKIAEISKAELVEDGILLNGIKVNNKLNYKLNGVEQFDIRDLIIGKGGN